MARALREGPPVPSRHPTTYPPWSNVSDHDKLLPFPHGPSTDPGRALPPDAAGLTLSRADGLRLPGAAGGPPRLWEPAWHFKSAIWGNGAQGGGGT